MNQNTQCKNVVAVERTGGGVCTDVNCIDYHTESLRLGHTARV